ncbi:unnamed protein product, partial [Ectocarpus sp. 12 AP-2014]
PNSHGCKSGTNERPLPPAFTPLVTSSSLAGSKKDQRVHTPQPSPCPQHGKHVRFLSRRLTERHQECIINQRLLPTRGFGCVRFPPEKRKKKKRFFFPKNGQKAYRQQDTRRSSPRGN